MKRGPGERRAASFMPASCRPRLAITSSRGERTGRRRGACCHSHGRSDEKRRTRPDGRRKAKSSLHAQAASLCHMLLSSAPGRVVTPAATRQRVTAKPCSVGFRIAPRNSLRSQLVVAGARMAHCLMVLYTQNLIQRSCSRSSTPDLQSRPTTQGHPLAPSGKCCRASLCC